MPELQDGIYHAPTKSPGPFFAIVFFRAGDGLRASPVGRGIEQLWAMWQDLRAGRVRDLPGTEVPGSGLTVLIGYGPGVFKLDGAGRTRPAGLAKSFLFRRPKGGGGGPLIGMRSHLMYAERIRDNRAAEHLAVQFIADTKLAVDRAVVETWKLLEDLADTQTTVAPVEMVGFYLGFQREDHRSWIDFHDGISNLSSEDRADVITIDHTPGDDTWLQGGTYLAFLRLAVDLRVWRRLDRSAQELLVGRDKLTGCPLVAVDGEIVPRPGCPIGGEPIWATANDPIAEPDEVADPRLRASHVHRANQHRPAADSRESLRIFRQGYEFLEFKESSPGFSLGLNFVSFQDTTERLSRILSQPGWLGDVNFGGDPDAQPAGMKSLVEVHAAGVYVVPPRVNGELFPGASIFFPP